jgi:DNA-binding LacI/PurR family transcriptional regulator
MTKKPNLKTLAHAAGVSVPTASQVMRGTGRISDETRKKVLKAAEHLHYVPDGRAASMRSGEKREIGMLIHRIANPFNAEVISGVSDHLEGHGYLVSILDSRDDVHHQKKNLEAFIRSSRGGLIWVPAHETPKTTIDMLRTHSIPTVTFLRESKFAQFDHVGLKNTEASYNATQHLIRLGHQKIVFFGGEPHSDVRQERIKGFKLALSENNLDQCIIWDAPDDKLSGVYELDRLLEQYPDTTALICNGDMVALGACFALQKTGKAPGRDLSIIGFDDIQDAALATPALSTISTRPYELGALLAKTILDRINDPSQPVKTSQIETQLILRDTTAAPT